MALNREAPPDARRMSEAYKVAEAQGFSVIRVDGEMIDAAAARILQNTLDRAGVGQS